MCPALGCVPGVPHAIAGAELWQLAQVIVVIPYVADAPVCATCVTPVVTAARSRRRGT